MNKLVDIALADGSRLMMLHDLAKKALQEYRQDPPPPTFIGSKLSYNTISVDTECSGSMKDYRHYMTI